MRELQHFYQQRAVSPDDDDGDDSKQLDCWELKDPSMAMTWTTLLAPHTAHLVFATTFKGEVKDPQHLDFETKITEFDDEGPNIVKLFCSSTGPDPYHFTIVIDTIRIPYSVVDFYDSLQGSNFDDVISSLRDEISKKEWHTAKGEPLKSKPLAKKLRSIMSAIERLAAVEQTKMANRRRADASGVTASASQMHS